MKCRHGYGVGISALGHMFDGWWYEDQIHGTVSCAMPLSLYRIDYDRMRIKRQAAGHMDLILILPVTGSLFIERSQDG